MTTLDERTAAERFAALSWVIAPRPIAWVTTVNRAGDSNLAPFSFFTIACTDPLVLALAIEPGEDGEPKDTLDNVLATGQLVVHLADVDCVDEVAHSGLETAPEFDELAALGLATTDALRVRPPVIEGCAAVFECELAGTCSFGRETVVFARVITSRVADRLLTASGRIDISAVRPLGRIGTAFSASALLPRAPLPQPAYPDETGSRR